MKNNITKMIAVAVFGLMVSGSAISSEVDWPENAFTVESSTTQSAYVSQVSFNTMAEDEISVIDMNYSSNN